MEIPQRALGVWEALAGDSGCLLPLHTARHRALGSPALPHGQRDNSTCGQGRAVGTAKTSRPAKPPKVGQGQPCRHLSLSLLQHGSCPETQRCLRPGGAGVPSPPAGAFHTD